MGIWYGRDIRHADSTGPQKLTSFSRTPHQPFIGFSYGSQTILIGSSSTSHRSFRLYSWVSYTILMCLSSCSHITTPDPHHSSHSHVPLMGFSDYMRGLSDYFHTPLIGFSGSSHTILRLLEGFSWVSHTPFILPSLVSQGLLRLHSSVSHRFLIPFSYLLLDIQRDKDTHKDVMNVTVNPLCCMLLLYYENESLQTICK